MLRHIPDSLILPKPGLTRYLTWFFISPRQRLDLYVKKSVEVQKHYYTFHWMRFTRNAIAQIDRAAPRLIPKYRSVLLDIKQELLVSAWSFLNNTEEKEFGILYANMLNHVGMPLAQARETALQNLGKILFDLMPLAFSNRKNFFIKKINKAINAHNALLMKWSVAWMSKENDFVDQEMPPAPIQAIQISRNVSEDILGKIEERVEKLLSWKGKVWDNEVANMLTRLDQYDAWNQRVAALRERISGIVLSQTTIIQNTTITDKTIPTETEHSEEVSVDRSRSIEYIEKFLVYTRHATSTISNSQLSKFSSWDGTVRQDAVVPLFIWLKTLIENGKVDPSYFSWHQVVSEFDLERDERCWIILKNICSNHREKEDFWTNLRVFLAMLRTLSDELNLPLKNLQQKSTEYIENNEPLY